VVAVAWAAGFKKTVFFLEKAEPGGFHWVMGFAGFSRIFPMSVAIANS